MYYYDLITVFGSVCIQCQAVELQQKGKKIEKTVRILWLCWCLCMVDHTVGQFAAQENNRQIPWKSIGCLGVSQAIAILALCLATRKPLPCIETFLETAWSSSRCKACRGNATICIEIIFKLRTMQRVLKVLFNVSTTSICFDRTALGKRLV